MTAAKTRKTSGAAGVGLCGLLLRGMRGVLTEAEVLTAIGNRCCRTLPEVGREFGQAHNTIKQSWRPEGMPGQPGRWPLAKILVWRLKYEKELEAKRQSPQDISERDIERRQAEADMRKVELQVERLEREELAAAGKLIDREHAATALKTLAAVLAEHVMKVPSQLEPSLPGDLAPSIVAEMQRMLRRALVGFAETSSRDVMKQGTALDL